MGKRHRIGIIIPGEKLTMNQVVKAANEEGLTYGKWVALYDPPKPKIRPPKNVKPSSLETMSC